jgi:hypothetical protein
MKHSQCQTVVFVFLFSCAAILTPAISISKTSERPVDAKEWAQAFQERFANSFCDPKNIDFSCYKNSSSQSCKNLVHSSFKGCLKRHKLLVRNNVIENRERWGKRMGLCLGSEVQKSWILDKEQDQCLN